ncbi:hypothetical protein GCM10027566_06560 [Arachidicoccus ginsenosidivorans]|uniref:Response regulator transcription factor n=1 Tax=Arachidicoccus ginsenosidivorans TaxID=496057 RepID=A0A5B8VT76_9BACT|nr:response regulator transcription factor [Arachidicoccus ginsenosidivorans]QEC73966.1 response regulator transcription factor [Arachidicoccus ginsenosidivorans]
MSFNILIASKHFPIANGMDALARSILGIKAKIERAQNFIEVIHKIGTKEFNMLISDLTMEGMDSFTMIERALLLSPDLRILFISLNQSYIFAPRFMEAGAYGFIRTTEGEKEFKRAISQIYLGKRFVPQCLLDSSMGNNDKKNIQNPFNLLSKQEFSVLLLLLKGIGIKEIASMTDLKISTASTYRVRIYNKLDVNNLIELFNLARHYNITTINMDVDF